MAAGMLDFESLISDTYTLDQVPQAMLDMTARNDRRVKFMIEMD